MASISHWVQLAHHIDTSIVSEVGRTRPVLPGLLQDDMLPFELLCIPEPHGFLPHQPLSLGSDLRVSFYPLKGKMQKDRIAPI